jgi:multidrug resistance protein MdtO
MERSINARVPWTELIRQELLPFHGRLAGSLRTTLAIAIAVTAVMVFRMPGAAPGIYLIFLVSYETPYLTFTSGLYTLAFQCLGVIAALLLVVATDNAPMARVLGTALFSFLAAFLLRTMRRRGGMDFGVFSLTTLALWDLHQPADLLVRTAMWPVAVGAIGVISAVAIEYAFARRDPFYALHKEFEARILAIENYLLAFGGKTAGPSLGLAAREVVRFSFAGQGRMLALLDEISNRREGTQDDALDLPLLLPHVFRLLDLAASFTLAEDAAHASEERKAHAARLALACAELREKPLEPGDALNGLETSADDDLLAEMENALVDLRTMKPHPVLTSVKTTGAPQPAPPWFVADLWSNPEYPLFSLKIAFCATLCYILCIALAWPGISTAVITVLIVGLNNTGAISQKLVFRLTGSFIGGVILGIGSVMFLFPNMDSIASLVALVCLVAFIGSWIARAPHFSYIGMQIVFSFFLIALGTFSAPVDMTPARDRLAGIGLALLVVWVVFLEISPARTVRQMRTALSRVLANEAAFILLPGGSAHSARRDAARLRETITRDLLNIRSMSELVPYEFASRSDTDREESARLLETSLAAGSLFLALEPWHHSQPAYSNNAVKELSPKLTLWAGRLEQQKHTENYLQESVTVSSELPARVASAQRRLAVSVRQLGE